MATKTKPKTEEIHTRTVLSTNDYTKFKVLPGNRQVNRTHVNQLIKLMVTNGNLTDQFPIVIDGEGFVIDGQHRLEALKQLGWEVGYVVEGNATIETVRRINQGNRNWSWRDVAESYANLGNKEYAWLLNYYDNHTMSFTLAVLFCGAKMNKGRGQDRGNGFNSGGFKALDKNLAELFATQYEQLREITDMPNHDFGKALNRIFRSPFYDHERMTKKMNELGHQLPIKASETDYRREIERIFNSGLSEENKVRLF